MKSNEISVLSIKFLKSLKTRFQKLLERIEQFSIKVDVFNRVISNIKKNFNILTLSLNSNLPSKQEDYKK